MILIASERFAQTIVSESRFDPTRGEGEYDGRNNGDRNHAARKRALTRHEPVQKVAVQKVAQDNEMKEGMIEDIIWTMLTRTTPLK
jgi:hypothetical protein